MSAFTPIEPDQLPRWVPGRLTVRSPEEGWPGLSVRGYRYAGSDVEVPSLRDYVIGISAVNDPTCCPGTLVTTPAMEKLPVRIYAATVGHP